MKNLGSFSRLASWVLVAASFFACDPEIPEVTILPEVYLDGVYNVSRNAATVEVAVVPNGQAYACIEYACGAECYWEKDTLLQVIAGGEMQKIEFRLNNLKYGSEYRYRVTVWNQAGAKQTEVLTFQTGGYHQARIPEVKAWEIDTVSGMTTVIVVPSDDDTTVISAEISTFPAGTWASLRSEETFFGRDSIKLSVELSQLSKDTEYQVRWKAKNRGGEVVAFSNFETFAVADANGNLYHAVTIGTQTWLQENLRCTKYANGDPIKNVTSNDEWAALSTGAYCWYNNDPKIGQEYGAIYNWWVASDARGLIPGYRTPTYTEFGILGNYVANNITCDAGPALSEQGTTYWKTSFGTNTSGFSARANGARSWNDGKFINIKEYATFISADQIDPPDSYSLWEITPKGWFDSNLYRKRLGAGLRLIKIEK